MTINWVDYEIIICALNLLYLVHVSACSRHFGPGVDTSGHFTGLLLPWNLMPLWRFKILMDCITMFQSYTRADLFELGSLAHERPMASLRHQLDHLFFRPFYWRRSGRSQRMGQRLQRPISVIAPHKLRQPAVVMHSKAESKSQARSALLYPQIQRHSNVQTRKLCFGLQNVQSINSKLDNVVDLLEDYHLNLLVLTETWHEDLDWVAIRILRGLGLSVIEAARPTTNNTRRDEANFVNQGGLAIITRYGINITKLDAKIRSPTFEHLCCKDGSGQLPIILAAIYRPGSQLACDLFFKELTTLFESLTTYTCRLYVVGDLNIHLERPAASDCQRFNEFLDTFDLHQQSCLTTLEAYWMWSLRPGTQIQMTSWSKSRVCQTIDLFAGRLRRRIPHQSLKEWSGGTGSTSRWTNLSRDSGAQGSVFQLTPEKQHLSWPSTINRW